MSSLYLYNGHQIKNSKIRKEYYVNHYNYWHKRTEVSFCSGRRRIGIYWRFRDWWASDPPMKGIKIGFEFLWFGFEFFIFPTVGINHDGRDLKILGFNGRIINEPYTNT
jgi:hypothetical protein